MKNRWYKSPHIHPRNSVNISYIKVVLSYNAGISFCYLGDIQVGMMDKKGQLEVEIIRARGLVVKPGSKTLPGKEEKP